MTDPELDAPRALAALVALAGELQRYVVTERHARGKPLKPPPLTPQEEAMRDEAIAELKIACQKWLELEEN